MRNNMNSRKARLAGVLMGATLCLAPGLARAAATITIINNNAPDVGFNDSTPADPVGGNPGTTMGEQRLNAFQYAADIWGATLDSDVEIKVLASFEPLSCTATTAVLGSAGAMTIWSQDDAPGLPLANTWYCAALANKLVGADLYTEADDPDNHADIRARFNSNLGNPGCLDGVFWYLGFDGNHGTQIDLVTVLLHEFAHGLGFQQFADLTTGAQFLNMSDVYGRNLFDLTLGKTWDQMTDTERKNSAINYNRVVWKGKEVTGAVPCALDLGRPVLRVTSPGSIAGIFAVGSAAFGPPLSSPGVSGQLVLANVIPPNNGCSGVDAGAAGRIVVVDRGSCTFVAKAQAAQAAGAIGVIVVNNVAGAPPPGLGGSDPSITIPVVSVTQSDGAAIKAAMALGPVQATLGVDLTVRAGADLQGRALMNAPNPVQLGSSISHWDPIAFPNQLMEPSINSDLTHSVAEPDDLTLALMRDIGWFPGWGLTKYDLNGNGCVDRLDYNALLAAIRARSNAWELDLNCDGKVNIADARVLVLHFTNPGGTPCP
jgi:hypothetical protein